jgi:hypothetical protein
MRIIIIQFRMPGKLGVLLFCNREPVALGMARMIKAIVLIGFLSLGSLFGRGRSDLPTCRSFGVI